MPTAGNLDLQEQSKAFWFREDKQWIEQENRIIHRYREACSLPCAATRRQPPHRLSRFYGQGYAESSGAELACAASPPLLAQTQPCKRTEARSLAHRILHDRTAVQHAGISDLLGELAECAHWQSTNG